MVASLCFEEDGVTLASGGNDCDIVLWDLVSFTAICRLRGHKDGVTGISFLCTQTQPRQQLLVSVSKDTLLKVSHSSSALSLYTYSCKILLLIYFIFKI